MDRQFLTKLRQRDAEVFAQVVRDHHRALVAMARPLVGDAEAEEAVQNAWLKAHGAIDRFEGRSSLRTWLGRIVLNEARMLLRGRGRERPFSDWSGEDYPLAERFTERGRWRHPPAHWGAESPEDMLTTEELAECLEALLSDMPANQRALFEMRDTQGLSFAEICNALGVSESNARVLLHRARARLFQLVDHYQETGEC